jgi:uncharacterized NAD-dependent epimerase/dehydratase family protein
MNMKTEGNAVIYCEGGFGTPNGKTAHGLVRFTSRYKVICVIDSTHTGKNANTILGIKNSEIPIVENLNQAVQYSNTSNKSITHFVVGLAPDGGRLDNRTRDAVIQAVKMKLNIDSGLHDYLSDDKEISKLAEEMKVVLRDVRKPNPPKSLHFFSGKIEEVKSVTIAVLGTDSAVGKRTTARLLVEALKEEGYKAELIGTGQTAWLQGTKYCIILDSIINDFVAGEIEHIVHKAWKEEKPDFIVLEGQGSLMHPAYPGGFELIAAGRPDLIILQHAPARKFYDGFPDYVLHSLHKQIKAVEMISGKPVAAITVNHENMTNSEVDTFCRQIIIDHDMPAYDVVQNGAQKLAKYMANISSRVTEKKIRFRRRLVSADE